MIGDLQQEIYEFLDLPIDSGSCSAALILLSRAADRMCRLEQRIATERARANLLQEERDLANNLLENS